MASTKKDILSKLAEGPVIGDGGFSHCMEVRGYTRAGSWTPDNALCHPEAVKQLHREFLRSGSDVMQAYTFFASDSNIEKSTQNLNIKAKLTAKETNERACKVAREVANEGDALVAANISEIPAYLAGKGKTFVQNEFRKQIDIFDKCGVDFIICEFISHIEEMEWAIEVAKETKKPVAATMYINPECDKMGVSTGECAVRMAKAGADIVGTNCAFDPNIALKTMVVMKNALDKSDLHPYLMIQAQGYWTPELTNVGEFAFSLPESPFAMEPRRITRFEAAKYARDCYKLGIHYIGGCCGIQPYHIRAISEELEKERGKVCQVTKELGHLAAGLAGSVRSLHNQRRSTEYWNKLEPCTGRPYSAALANVPNSTQLNKTII